MKPTPLAAARPACCACWPGGHAAVAARWLAATAPPAAPSSDELPFEQAVAQATDGLVAQTQKLPAFLARVEAKLNKRGVVLDPMLDAASGQQTNATQLLERGSPSA